ncbi:DoxX family protein [Pelagibius sp.]|uniref:DoxX family protein n=1 Tax=Pelagibius sp. TaxID=1931238 RepID=UPI002621B3CF|nr:DoxX family protein [Pelagibius sp.]
MISHVTALHGRVFGFIEAKLDGWFLGLGARLVFAAVLAVYYLHSAATKVGDGLLGFFSIGDNAYFQILPSVVEAYGYDASQVPFFPYDLIVFAGTYAEFVLPVLIVLGLFTRLAALGMIGFIVVQSYVDIAFHGVDAATIGVWFDRLPSAAILDQRALWVFLLVYLAVRGAGALSLDALLGRRALGRRPTTAAQLHLE